MYVEKYVLIGVFTCHKKKSVWFVCLFLYYSFSVFLLILTSNFIVNKQLQDTIRNWSLFHNFGIEMFYKSALKA